MAAPLITLTSDLGTKDFYVPLVKAFLVSRLPAANIVDITHQISPFNIADAAFIVRNCYKSFPAGSIHLISIESDLVQAPGFIMVKAAGHYFLTFDNGLISLIVDDEEVEQVRQLSWDEKGLLFPMRDILAAGACSIAEGRTEIAGSTRGVYQRLSFLKPTIEEHIIRGTIVYIDNYGNAITNIFQNDLKQAAKGRKYRIYMRRNEYVDDISTHYNAVPEGEKLCLAGTTGLLEIAINKGNAGRLLGLYPGHAILIEFE